MLNKILIIDDDKELCEELTDILCDEEYFVNTSNDGLKGKKIIRGCL